MATAVVQQGRFYTSRGQPSHFTVEELWCPCCQRWNLVEQSLIDALESYRQKVGKPVHITSGFRCRKHNADPKVGGATFSRHPMGLAADTEVRDGDRSMWSAALIALRCFHRVIVVPNGFLHLDVDDSGGFGIILVRMTVKKKKEYWSLNKFLRQSNAGVLLDELFGKF